MNRYQVIDAFSILGERLQSFGNEPSSISVIDEACEANRWFTPHDILRAVASIRTQMLQKEKLRSWLRSYPCAATQKDVALIMAGNIPLVGFADLLCVLVSGHRALVKPSSKDTILIRYIISLLNDIEPGLTIEEFTTQSPHAVIATGSNNTNRYFRSKYKEIKTLLRANRSSVAVLSGRETDHELELLADDVFSYSGLGCRNVSLLFIPRGYDTDPIKKAFCSYGSPNPKYLNNYRQRSALLNLNGENFVDGGFYVMSRSELFPAHLSEIAYTEYDSPGTVADWLVEHDSEIQCCICSANIGKTLNFSRCVSFGTGQAPELTDYPDDRDTMSFLCSI